MKFAKASFAGLALLAGLLTTGTLAHAALPAGAAAPAFSLPASRNGKEFQFVLQDALQRGPVVVYFYPAAYTSGCDLEAHTFSEHAQDFSAAGASIIGVSLDSIERLNRFSADPNYCAGKIPVASDQDGKVAHAYDLHTSAIPASARDTRGDVIGHAMVERTTFVVKPDGKVLASVGNMAPDDNVMRTLEIVRSFTHKN